MPEEQQQPAVNGEGGEPPKTAKQLEKEAKKAEKLAKLQAKLDKKAATAPAAGEKKEKPEVSTFRLLMQYSMTMTTDELGLETL